MTQAQQQSVVLAQKKFFDAESAATAAQALSATAESDVEAAKMFATVTAPAQAQALVKGANDAFFKAQADQQLVIQAAQQAQVALSQAQVDLTQAILDSLQTGAQEVIPANQVAQKPV
jgi:hypothetical protein